MSATSEHYVLAENEAEAIWFLGTLATVKAAADRTGGALSIVEFTHPPGFATPPHIHHTTDEGFYVLGGRDAGILRGPNVAGDARIVRLAAAWHPPQLRRRWRGDASVLGDHPARRLRALRRGGGGAGAGADLAPARGAGHREAGCRGRQGRYRTPGSAGAVDGGRSRVSRVGDRHRGLERLVGEPRAYSPNLVEGVFAEVRVAPVHHL